MIEHIGIQEVAPPLTPSTYMDSKLALIDAAIVQDEKEKQSLSPNLRPHNSPTNNLLVEIGVLEYIHGKPTESELKRGHDTLRDIKGQVERQDFSRLIPLLTADISRAEIALRREQEDLKILTQNENVEQEYRDLKTEIEKADELLSSELPTEAKAWIQRAKEGYLQRIKNNPKTLRLGQLYKAGENLNRLAQLANEIGLGEPRELRR